MELLKLRLNTTTNDDRPIYITGNFNNWKVNDNVFQLKKISDGIYHFSFPKEVKLPSILEYKYVRGDWGAEELTAYGEKGNNRFFDTKELVIEDNVPHWEQNGLSYEPRFLPDIAIIDENFEIPQLNKTRKVRILLPHNYYQISKRYPVLYLQDGQNLYDEDAPFGNWGINKKLAVLMQQGRGEIIVVGIDHGERERVTEYIPVEHLELGIGKGEGTKYVEFMRDTLKPYVDKHFRTLPESKYTGVGGSSMGGLISLYAGLYAPEVFGRLLIFSPSLWIYPDLFEEIQTNFNIKNLKIYIYAGGDESETMIPKVKKLQKILDQQQANNIKTELVINPKGKHTEACWRAEFGQGVVWLFDEGASK